MWTRGAGERGGQTLSSHFRCWTPPSASGPKSGCKDFRSRRSFHTAGSFLYRQPTAGAHRPPPISRRFSGVIADVVQARATDRPWSRPCRTGGMMKLQHRRAGRCPERGAVLVVVLLVMMTLLGLGVMTLWLTSANLQVGSTVNMRTQALYVADAGLERARGVLNASLAPNVPAMLAGATAPYDDVPTGVDASGY